MRENKKHFVTAIQRGLLPIFAVTVLFFACSGCSSPFREVGKEKTPEITGEYLKNLPKPMEKSATLSPAPWKDMNNGLLSERNDMIMNLPNSPSPRAADWITHYSRSGNPHEVILDQDGIHELNRRIRENCPTMNDMGDVPASVPGEEVAAWIRKGKSPGAWKVDEYGSAIDSNRLSAIERNRNIEGIPSTVAPKTAIVTARTDLRTLPTGTKFFDETDKGRYYDRIQETELVHGTPVLVLHQSGDGTFLFVRSYYYDGWVKAADIAYAEREDYNLFLPEHPVQRVCITAPFVTIDGRQLDMGAVFPYVADDGDSFRFSLPLRAEDGMLRYQTVSAAKADAHYGYLPYTMANFYTQAFKHEGRMYGWGGADGGIDCSGFVCAVFRSFGLYLPRNTGEQKNHSGTTTSLAGLGAIGVKDALGRLSYPTAIHRPGHVMLYLGTLNGRIYVIHAPQGGQTVGEMELAKLDNLTTAGTVY